MKRTRTRFLIFGLSCFLASQTLSQNVMDFDGINDNISVPNASNFIASGPMSLSAWVYPTNPNPGWPDFDGILGFRNNYTADFYLLQLSTTSIEARFRNSAGTNFDIVYNGLNLNAWNHFVFTYDNATLTLYHDGTSVMTLAANGTIISTTETFNIGVLPFQANPFYFDGQLDDVALWDVSLSASQVTSLYSSCSLDPSASNLVLAYEFNQGTPGGNNTGITSIIDSKSNANGVLSGFALTGTSSNFVADSKPLSTSFFSLTEFSCGPYTSPSGNAVWTTSGIYADTIVASAGCDSIYTVDLTVSTASTSSLTIAECDYYINPSGDTLTASGLYADTIQNVAGCDSIISISLSIATSTMASITVNECDSYTSPSGIVWTLSGVYNDTISNNQGCDSVLVIDLSIQNNSTADIQESACESYTSPSGTFTWTSSGIYVDTIQNAAGCDSILSIDLTIQSINPTVSQSSSNELMADSSGLSYQWFDCSNNEAIPGETNQSFTATSSGSYAVVMSDDACTDTSACFDLMITGIFDLEQTISFQLFPNPAKEVAILTFSDLISSGEIQILNTLGQEIETKSFVHRQSVDLPVSHLEAGIYIIQVIANGNIGSMKFLKN